MINKKPVGINPWAFYIKNFKIAIFYSLHEHGISFIIFYYLTKFYIFIKDRRKVLYDLYCGFY